ncbi:MAG: hypothetical protein IKU60_03465 [Clostridia bacterium]|nr:hypothetical protein [Clostridia bacterium]
MLESADRTIIDDMINHTTEDIESILKEMPLLEKATLCHKIASPLAWDNLRMADDEITDWCVYPGASSVREWYESYTCRASFVKNNLCDSVLGVWSEAGIREKINERARAVYYAIYGKFPKRLDFAGVIAFRLFGKVELDLPTVPMEKLFDKKILPLRLCDKVLLRRFVPFFSREYVYKCFEKDKYMTYLKICSLYEAHFMKREYEDCSLGEYIDNTIKNMPRTVLYDALCGAVNLKER